MRKLLLMFLLVYQVNVYGQIEFRNPILSGFYPDPSVVRVGEDYYLVNSTFAYFPGIPVFHSKDLKNWKQIASVISRPSQMNFLGDGTSRGLFAPAISYHQGVFYLTCTHVDKKGNFVVTAKNPAGPWSDPVYLPQVKGIDPSLFFDQDKAYIVYNSDAPDGKALYSGHRTIRCFQFDPVNLRVKGEEEILVNGGADFSKKPVWIEGPHLFKRNGFYYLSAAEGGTGVNHSQVIFRSDSPSGPFIPYKNNPILTQRDLDPSRKNPITSTGHADFIEGPDGKTYAVFLGVRPYEGNYYNTGRETFIAPVSWLDGWPIINPGHKSVQYKYSAGFKEYKQKDALPQNGDFAYRLSFPGKIDESLLFLRTRDTSWFTFDKPDGLRFKLGFETIMGGGNPSFIGKRQQHLRCEASTKIDFATKKENEKAGLVIFQSEYNFYYLCKSFSKGHPVVQLFQGNPVDRRMDIIAESSVNTQQLLLKIAVNRERCDFYFADQKGHWKLLKSGLDARLLSTQSAGGFIGSLFGLYATSSGKPSLNTASFKWLDYSGNDRNDLP